MDAVDLAHRCAERMYADDLASQALGITISDVTPGAATASMKIRPEMVNGHDICHGGYVFTLADTAMAFAGNTYDEVTVASGAEINFLEPVHAGAILTAVATQRSRRGRSGLYDVTVRTDDGTIVAEFRGRTRSVGRKLL